MNILFHSNQLGYRGTEVALYDYAIYNEEILNNSSIIISPKQSKLSSPESVQRFSNRFKVIFYDCINDIDNIASKNNIDLLYCIKSGKYDGIISHTVKTCIHAVFMEYDPHGDVYAYVSKWLSKAMNAENICYVPHIVKMPKTNNNFREYLNIPNDAIVFGQYGGDDSFNIKFAKKAVKDISDKSKNTYFIFMNTKPVKEKLFYKLPNNIIYLPKSSDLFTKAAFINTCDAMLHARKRGETFGLAIGEFSAMNKPIITYLDSPEKAHIEILGDKGIYYRNYNELCDILINFRPDQYKNWDCYSSQFSPEIVMQQFKKVFIDS